MNKKFHLQIGEPTVISQGKVGDNQWGHTQFPYLYYTAEGDIYADWEYTSDTIDYDGVSQATVSSDGGKTWHAAKKSDRVRHITMKNGKEFVGFMRKGAHSVDYLKKYVPAYEDSNELFWADDIEEPEDKRVFATEVDPVTGEETVFECTINWPYMPLKSWDGKVFPTAQWFALQNQNGIIEADGKLYFTIYANGFHSDANNREEAVANRIRGFSVYVFCSDDCGRTWNYTSQVNADESVYATAKLAPCEGFCEPAPARMPDGSFIILLRTGCNNPIYIVRSTDNCKTWSEPKIFDTIGVRPMLLTLPCGVTLASYGRPMLRICATYDPAGINWIEPITIPLYGETNLGKGSNSCFYTSLLPTGDNTALMIYSDFDYPNTNGIPVKSILVREVTVVFD